MGEQRVIKQFIADKVDLICAFPTEPALTAKQATEGTNIPVVFAMGTIEKTGLVESVRQPGGRIAGVRFNGPDLVLRELEILLELAPRVKRIWVVRDTSYPAGICIMELLSAVVLSKDVTVVTTHVGTLEDLRAVIEERDKLSYIGIDAIQMLADVIALSPPGFSMISTFSIKHNVPISGGAGFAIEQGAVFTTVPDKVEMGALAAPLADKILKGGQAGHVPVVSPESHLRINYRESVPKWEIPALTPF